MILLTTLLHQFGCFSTFLVEFHYIFHRSSKKVQYETCSRLSCLLQGVKLLLSQIKVQVIAFFFLLLLFFFKMLHIIDHGTIESKNHRLIYSENHGIVESLYHEATES